MSSEQQMANCKLALKLWQERVKPEQVVANLASYRCGTQACFGGHLTTWPEFRAMGVSALDGQYLPQLRRGSGSYEYGQCVAWVLFGTGSLFAQRNWAETGTDYEVVIKRLEARIQRLEKELS